MKVYAGSDSAVGSAPDCKYKDRGFEPRPGHIFFVEIRHGIISTVILSLPLIQKKRPLNGQLLAKYVH